MGWSERQRRMLAEMGLRVWTPPAPPARADEGAGPAAGGAVPASADVAVEERMPSLRPTVAVREAPRVSAPASASSAGMSAVPPAAARAPSPLDGQDWDALREAVDQCRACRLCDSRGRTVFGVGHRQAQVMVIGEAPGEQEDRQGEPFVGPAGQLLDAMLRSIGLSREDGPPERQVFIANTLKCRPPGNRNPQPDELAACEPFLQRQIALVQPRVILAMGRFAVQALLRSSEPVGKLRGRVHQYEGVPLVVTYHPAYLLRNLPDKARAWDDLCLLGELLTPGRG